MASHAEIADGLLAEYASRLDSSLILAIAAEIDPTSKDSEQEARATLSALADAASDQGDAHDYVQPPASGSQQQHPANGHLANLRTDDTDGTSSIEEKSVDTAPSTTTTATSDITDGTSPASTDEEAVERAFREWSLGEHEDLQDDSDPKKDYSNGTPTFAQLARDPIAFLRTLFPKRERIELQLALEDAGEDVEVRRQPANAIGRDTDTVPQAAIETLLTEELLIREEEEYETLLMQADADTNGASGGSKGKKHRHVSRNLDVCLARIMLKRPNSGIENQASKRFP